MHPYLIQCTFSWSSLTQERVAQAHDRFAVSEPNVPSLSVIEKSSIAQSQRGIRLDSLSVLIMGPGRNAGPWTVSSIHHFTAGIRTPWDNGQRARVRRDSDHIFAALSGMFSPDVKIKSKVAPRRASATGSRPRVHNRCFSVACVAYFFSDLGSVAFLNSSSCLFAPLRRKPMSAPATIIRYPSSTI